jgi:hypothetical protein
VRPLDPKLIESLRARCPLEVYDNRFVVIPFSMANVLDSEKKSVRN